MIQSSVATPDSFARLRLPVSDASLTRGRVSTAEMAVKTSVSPEALLRQIRAGRGSVEVSASMMLTTQNAPTGGIRPAATFTKSEETPKAGGPTADAVSMAPAMQNQATPGAVRVSA